MNEKYEVVIGLEIHAQLKTDSKIFCACSTRFGDEPNSNTCPVCLGLPGALPVLNHRVIEMAARAALALNSKINHESIFSRKNYFYPDLPKGFQISQFPKVFSGRGGGDEVEGDGVVEDFNEVDADGVVEIPTSERNESGHAIEWKKRKFRIKEIHIEEDAGKSLHEGMSDATKSYVDLNRSGVPLVEIVSEPDFRSSWQAYDYMHYVRRTLQFIDVCDGNMEEGSLRCDANVSVRLRGAKKFGTKVELKNLNSFRFLQKAIDYEVERQIAAIEAGGRIVQETRRWNEREAKSMRSKEEAHDYRYFPEPDLPPLCIDQAFVERLRSEMPELPEARRQRFIHEYGLSFDDASQLIETRALAEYFEETARVCENPKAAANWILNELMRELKKAGVEIAESPVSPASLGGMIDLIDGGSISGKMAKDVMIEMYRSGRTADEVVREAGGSQVSDEGELRALAEKAIGGNPKQTEQYRAGKTSLFGFFVGQVMKLSGGRANPQVVNDVLKQLLDGSSGE